MQPKTVRAESGQPLPCLPVTYEDGLALRYTELDIHFPFIGVDGEATLTDGGTRLDLYLAYGTKNGEFDQLESDDDLPLAVVMEGRLFDLRSFMDVSFPPVDDTKLNAPQMMALAYIINREGSLRFFRDRESETTGCVGGEYTFGGRRVSFTIPPDQASRYFVM